jgi:N-acetylglucosaminyldiphosphoundecaprenol N-acetyl-beta-D-mannosaminyltransferase
MIIWARCDISASRQAFGADFPCAINTSIWRSSVTICSALKLFFDVIGSLPSHSLTTLGLKQPGQANLLYRLNGLPNLPVWYCVNSGARHKIIPIDIPIIPIDIPLGCRLNLNCAAPGMRIMPVVSSHVALAPARLSEAPRSPDTAEPQKNGFAAWPDDLSREVYGVLGFPLDVVDMATVLRRIRNADDNAEHFLISTTNLNYLVISRRDAEFRKSLLFSDLCTADGMPIVWIPRLLGVPINERIAGSDIIDALKSSHDTSRRLKVFLFGGPEGVSDAACQHINATSDSMTCVGSYYPGYATIDELSTDHIIDMINSSEADLLIACLGARKGQTWLQQNHDRLQIPIRVHLGAAVKYEAGTIKRAPAFMQRWGLEWLWRIKEEPHLCSRYLKDGVVLLQLLLTRIIPLVFLARWHRLRRGHNEQDLLVMCNEHNNSVTLSLCGPATARHVHNAIPRFQEALNAQKPIIINFTDTDLIDARFIGLLLMLQKQLKKRGLPLGFKGIPSRIERILRLNGFGFLLRA